MREKATLFIQSISDEIFNVNQESYDSRLGKKINKEKEDIKKKSSKKVTPPVRDEEGVALQEKEDIKESPPEDTKEESVVEIQTTSSIKKNRRIKEKLNLIARRSKVERPVFVDLYTEDKIFRGYVKDITNDILICTDENKEEYNIEINTINKVMILEL